MTDAAKLHRKINEDSWTHAIACKHDQDFHEAAVHFQRVIRLNRQQLISSGHEALFAAPAKHKESTKGQPKKKEAHHCHCDCPDCQAQHCVVQMCRAEHQLSLALKVLADSDHAALKLVFSGSSESFDQDDMKRAYRKLALRYHPDRDEDGSAVFLLIQEAYEKLCQEHQRSQLFQPQMKKKQKMRQAGSTSAAASAYRGRQSRPRLGINRGKPTRAYIHRGAYAKRSLPHFYALQLCFALLFCTLLFRMLLHSNT